MTFLIFFITGQINTCDPSLMTVVSGGLYEFFADAIADVISRDAERKSVYRIVSLGSGNCDIEIGISKELGKLGVSNYVIECIDIVQEMLDRGRQLAEDEGLSRYFKFNRVDNLSWAPAPSSIDVVMVHQSLHHFIDLENLFDKIKSAIGDGGIFVISDVIGRNGHMRWSEAMHHIDRLWSDMPDRYKYNHLLRRNENRYINWDCSSEGFEGVRAQDILPLLLERFNFKLFLA